MSPNSPRKETPQKALRSQILRSQDTVSDILRVKPPPPANRQSECCLPTYLLSIHLGQPIQLQRLTKVNGRVRKH